jgi:hypothetical protein
MFADVSEVPRVTNLNDKLLFDCLTFWTHFAQLSPDPHAAVKADPHFIMNSLYNPSHNDRLRTLKPSVSATPLVGQSVGKLGLFIASGDR